MVTVFCIPKAFDGYTGRIQENAIRSWGTYFSDFELLLCGDDRGVKEFAREVGGRHLPNIATNDAGTPLVSDLFRKAQKAAASDLLLYLNADIILVDDLPGLIREAHGHFDDRLLAVGERWDLEVERRLDFSNPDQIRNDLLNAISDRDSCGPSAIDYFGFERGGYADVPDFAIGRMGWDNWLLADAKASGFPVVDLTPRVKAIHQEHERPDVADEITRNLSLVDELGELYTLRSVDWMWTESGAQRPPLARRLLGWFSHTWLGRRLLTYKRRGYALTQN